MTVQRLERSRFQRPRIECVKFRAGPLVIVDCEGTFYPPAAVSLGVPSERMILLRPRGGSRCDLGDRPSAPIRCRRSGLGFVANACR